MVPDPDPTAKQPEKPAKENEKGGSKPASQQKPAEGEQRGGAGSQALSQLTRGRFAVVLLLYAVLFGVWVSAEYIADAVAENRYKEAPGWLRYGADSVSLDSIKVPLRNIQAAGLDSLRVDETTVSLTDSAMVQIPRDRLWLRMHLEQNIGNFVSARWVNRVKNLVAIGAALAIIGLLAWSGYRLEYARWTAVSVFVLLAVLMMLGVEVVEWLAETPPNRGMLSTLKGSLLGSAMGGITYVLINVGSRWRRLSEKVSLARRQTIAAHLQARRRLQEMWSMHVPRELKADEPMTAEALNRWTAIENKFLAELEKHDMALEDLLQKEVAETGDPMKTAYRSVHLDRRLMHVIMSMGLAAGFVVLGTALGVDFLNPQQGDNRQFAAVILGVSFLVGMFPRVFERFMKKVADRLAGTEKDDEDDWLERLGQFPVALTPGRPGNGIGMQAQPAVAEQSGQQQPGDSDD